MPKKILVVDDDRTMTQLLKTLLELDGFSVILALRGDIVIPTAMKESPDAILMDVHIGDADGLEILRQIRQHPTLKKLPVVISSGRDVEDECATLGASAFILKPYPPEQLSKTLRNVIA